MHRGPENKISPYKEKYRKVTSSIKNGLALTAEELHAYKDDVIFYRYHAKERRINFYNNTRRRVESVTAPVRATKESLILYKIRAKKKRLNFYKNVKRKIEPVAAPARAYRNDFLYYKFRFDKKRDTIYNAVADKAEDVQHAIAEPTLPQVIGAVAGGMAVTLAATIGFTEAVRYALDHHGSPAGSSAPQVPGGRESHQSQRSQTETHHNRNRRIRCETMLPGYNYRCVIGKNPIVLELGVEADFAYPHNGKGEKIEFPVQKNGTGSFSLPNGERLRINREGNTIYIRKLTY